MEIKMPLIKQCVDGQVCKIETRCRTSGVSKTRGPELPDGIAVM
jgi:hypothetical protein